MEIKIPIIEKIYDDTIKRFFKWIFKDRREMLPHEEVVIGTFTKDKLSVDIRAKIFLREKTQPPVEIFLDRISIKDPYCANVECQKPLNIVNADWLPIGYKCISCQTEMRIERWDIIGEIKGEIRQKYSDYWCRYCKAIYKLTRGKPQRYKLE